MVDFEGRPRENVTIEMEKRVARVWVSVTDARTRAMLPRAEVRLLDAEGGVAHAFERPGHHDAALGDGVAETAEELVARLAGASQRPRRAAKHLRASWRGRRVVGGGAGREWRCDAYFAGRVAQNLHA